MEAFLLLKIFLVVLIQSATGVKRIPSFAGPYRVILRHFSNVTEEYKSQGDFWTKLRIQSTTSGHVPYGWGRAFNRIPIDDNIRLNFPHACSDALYHAPALLRLIYGKDGTKCPVHPGDRIIPNKSLDLHFPQFPVFPYGRWLFTLVGFVKDRIAGIHTLEGDTVPKV